jgi:hypothetical protein
MALVKCPECKKKISSKAQACPSCGAPQAKQSKAADAQSVANAGCGCATLLAVGLGLLIYTSKPDVSSNENSKPPATAARELPLASGPPKLPVNKDPAPAIPATAAKPAADKQAIDTPVETQDIELKMEVTPEVQADNRVVVKIKSNLPKDTELRSSLYDSVTGNGMGQVKGSVGADGVWVTPAIGRLEGLPPGKYSVNVTMPIVRLQPDLVKKVVGKNGERLSGPLVDRSDLGVSAQATKEFVIGGEKAAELQAENLRKEIDSYRGLLKQVQTLEKGLLDTRKMKLLEDQDDLEALGKWGQFARKFRSDQEAIDAEIKKLKNMGAKLRLAAANGDLGLMFQATASSNQPEFKKVSGIYSESVQGAQEFIKELESKLPATESSEKFEAKSDPVKELPRTWKDNTGKFSVDATLIEVLELEVVLEKSDGSRVNVAIERLSDEDKTFLQKRKPK